MTETIVIIKIKGADAETRGTAARSLVATSELLHQIEGVETEHVTLLGGSNSTLSKQAWSLADQALGKFYPREIEWVPVHPPERRFAVGDRVEYVGSVSEVEGSLGTVIEQGPGDVLTVKFDRGGDYELVYVASDTVRPAAEEPKFKAGDRVTYLGPEDGRNGGPRGLVRRRGDEAVVREQYQYTGYIIEFVRDGYKTFAYESRLKEVEPPVVVSVRYLEQSVGVWKGAVRGPTTEVWGWSLPSRDFSEVTRWVNRSIDKIREKAGDRGVLVNSKVEVYGG